MLLGFIARRAIAAFERRYDYDARYLRELLASGGLRGLGPARALAAIGRYRHGVPANVYFAAKLTAALAADCGPCARLTVRMAEESGVSRATIAAILRGERHGLSTNERHAVDLARATLAREAADAARDALRTAYGATGLASIAWGMVAATGFPTLKYALGHGHACERLRIGDTIVDRGAHASVTTA